MTRLIESAGALGSLLGLLLAVSAPGTSRAEGSGAMGAELDISQALREDCDLYVDILDADTETFVWTGKGDVEVFDPMGRSIGMFSSGDTIDPALVGSYKIDLQENQFDVDAMGDIIRSTIVPWDVTVSVSGTPRPGRVYSFSWRFNTGTFQRIGATDASFFARVPGGDDESFAVMDLRVVGLAGFIFEIQGNHTGVRGPDAGRSVPEAMHSAADEFRMYLNPPDNASYSYVHPTVSDLTFRSGLEVGGAVGMCDEFVPGVSMGEFRFNTNVDGTFHLICDLNRDGVFDIVSDGDFLILGNAMRGENVVPFDGLDNHGDPFDLGDHDCRVRVTVGEFHYVGRDIETAFEGIRMFHVDPDATRHALQMYWNDAAVQMNAVTMPRPYAYIGASTSGPAGLNSGNPADPPVPLGEGRPRAGANSRAWGDFVSTGGGGNGKGNEAYLDTYTWLDEALSDIITIHAVDGTLDTDGEGLSDYTEDCITGTLFDNPDSDGDSVDDFVETMGGTPGVDHDDDGTIDAFDENDDDDCVLTIDEDPDGSGTAADDDTDMDGLPDYLDVDDDGDGVLTCDEDTDGDGNAADDDTDGDGTPDYLDRDSDGDCDLMPAPVMCLDGRDGCRTEPETINGYEDDDGCPEEDNDLDGVPDIIDNCPPPEGTRPDDFPMGMHPTYNPPEMMGGEQPDLDGDGLGDVCDPDRDGDGLDNECEVAVSMCPPDCEACADTDPDNPDSDDGCSMCPESTECNDGAEVSRGSDPNNGIDDCLTGVTGGGVFDCAASSNPRGTGRHAGLLLALVAAVLLVRRRRSRRRRTSDGRGGR